ncbi:hypothetical protein [Bradyrhizobium valentinum]|uniref:Uncharacterized protein n=1 Tax=Bradyrhizobium valentinum TaxID=1518501 RepID=A0A0R3KV31_9BRAD|nr:hypothetical protein [Bradyrhizobium valentinum]KRQ99283.1 hypothetical protein CP49_11850 [Bradyrhizobium valentinum]
MALAARKPSHLLVPERRVLIPQRRVLRPRHALPGIAPLPVVARPPVTPGSTNYTTPGTYSFTVPHFNSFFADVRGASGGGGGVFLTGPYSTDGTAGGYSYFNAPTGNLVGYGGGGGGRAYYHAEAPSEWEYYDYSVRQGANGAHGTGVNGDYNGTGDATSGGAGAYTYNGEFRGGAGGNGARAYRTWLYGSALTPGSTITVVVGARGSSGQSETNPALQGNFAQAQYGVNGAVYLSWS